MRLFGAAVSRAVFLAGILTSFLPTSIFAQSSARSRASELASFTARDVAVKISLVRRADGKRFLSATYTPFRKGFYLYAKDLPRNGVRGLGRPTLLEIVSSPVLKATGALTADKPTTDLVFKSLNLTFPVYPAGRVTLTLPVTQKYRGERRAILSVTYMTCSDQVCMPPVEDKRIAVTLPDR